MIFKLFKFQKNIGHIFFDDMDTDLLKTLIRKGIRVELSANDEHSSNDVPVADYEVLSMKDRSHPSNKRG